MACTPQEMVTASTCLVAGMSERQLLAYIAYQLAVNAGEDPTAANLAALSKCLWIGLSERQLLAAIALFACESVPT